MIELKWTNDYSERLYAARIRRLSRSSGVCRIEAPKLVAGSISGARREGGDHLLGVIDRTQAAVEMAIGTVAVR